MKWFMLGMIFFGVLEVTQRYVFNHPTMWGYELIIMLGAAMYPLTWACIHRRHGHVRVDVFYSRMSIRGKAIVDVVCGVLFFFPVILFLVYTSGVWMWHAWEIGEKSVETYWYPPIAPLRTAVFVGVVLFLVQGVAQFIRDAHLLVRGRPYD
ncbi:MAG: TRAP transporter small permease subunit [Chloroflexi bacterium]|nr:TRAP transporter small permease subunit [Chloroflexota bacterium]